MNGTVDRLLTRMSHLYSLAIKAIHLYSVLFACMRMSDSSLSFVVVIPSVFFVSPPFFCEFNK